MRVPDLTSSLPSPLARPLEGEEPLSVGVVGRGRLGTALAIALREAGHPVDGPAGHGEVPTGAAIVLCVPDGAIGDAARAVASAGAAFVGHTSGATGLSELAPAAPAAGFGLHPLQTFSGGSPSFAGCACAVGGTSPEALELARALALALGMSPFTIADEHRPAYHAAASVASNFLVTLEHAAERLAGAAGLEGEHAREALAPLVRTTVERWAELGAERTLTGPLARGDHATVAKQREAVDAHAPELLALWDALAERTAALAAEAAARPAPARAAEASRPSEASVREEALA